MVNVTDGADVNVWFVTFKFTLSHRRCSLLLELPACQHSYPYRRLIQKNGPVARPPHENFTPVRS